MSGIIDRLQLFDSCSETAADTGCHDKLCCVHVLSYLIRHTLVCTRSYTYNTLIVSCFYIDDLHCKTVQSWRQKCRNLCAVRASHNVPSDSITSTVNNLLTVPDPFCVQVPIGYFNPTKIGHSFPTRNSRFRPTLTLFYNIHSTDS